MKVAILGSGNGGCAAAFDWAQHGHEVRLWNLPNHAHHLHGVMDADGRLTAMGVLEGEVQLHYVGTDPDRALAGAELVLIVGPAYATDAIAEAVAPHLDPQQRIVVMPTSCVGSVVVKKALGVDLRSPDWVVGETSTLPYAVRLTGPSELTVFHKLHDGHFVAGLPRSSGPELAELLCQVYPGTTAATSVWQTTLQNGNPVIHPAVTLLNAGLLERTDGGFLFYEEGVTPGVGRLIEGVDHERLALGHNLGVDVLSEPVLGHRQGYMTQENYSTGYSKAPGFKGIGAQGLLDHRYLNEDVGYGLVFLSDLGRRVGVPTPTIDAVIQIASVVRAVDFRAEAPRTLASLGLADYDLVDLLSL
ncbi:MAG TPA: NAD/NADP octopine/nopaline dehydrogenase family protein [Dermatophilaceae bacterium]|nr:NAD/NADP octopine/nopaline dehydrogenase family protein [Dermatophilaceae bacterium]